MKLLSLIFCLFVLIPLAGCSHFYANRDNLNEQIDEWLAENEFAKINNTLKYLSSAHPDYKKIKNRKQEIEKKRADFIRDSIARADRKVAEEKWQQALDICSEAQRQLPDENALNQHKARLLAERDTQVQELRKNMLLRRARALVQYQAIYEKLEKLIPDDYNARYDINKYKSEKQELAAELMDCGEFSLEARDYSLAEECIDLSNQLLASEAKQKSLASIRKTKKNLDNRRRSSELIEAYHAAYDGGDFPRARYHLETLIALDGSHSKARELKAQLDRDINLRVEKGITEGKTLYSQGKINEALAVWEGLLKIDPKNEELASLISRGKKVSSKIRKLEKSAIN
jgi:hypothetical protein